MKSLLKLCVAMAVACSSAVAADPMEIKAAAEKGLALLQKCGPEFFKHSGCFACHQQSVTSLAVGAARSRGLKVDEEIAREQVHVTVQTVKSFRSRLLQRVDHPLNSAPSAGYTALGLHAEKYPPDDSTDALMIELAGRQGSDGSWTAFSHRPPLEYSRVSATALAVMALKAYGPPGLKTAFDKRVNKARAWLEAVKPSSTTDHAFRLLGLHWSGAEKTKIAEQRDALSREQKPDGGWSELPDLEPDAYATGLALYALHEGGGLATSDAVYAKGVEQLLRTQQADGSWHVKTRTFPFQPYFESGFPHGADQWISATATGFATTALIAALPSKN